MIPLFSHKAIVTIEVDGHLEDGEWIEGSTKEIEVKGRYFPSNSGNQVRKNDSGNEFIVKGEFTTKREKVKGATRIRIAGKGVDAKIEDWHPYDTHSVIYI